MKRVAFIFGVLVLLLVLVVALAPSNPNAPRLVNVRQPGGLLPYDEVNYNFLDPTPFAGGRLWLWLRLGSTNTENLLYSIGDKKVIGRLINGRTELITADPALAVCSRPVSEERSLKQRLRGLLEPVLHFFPGSPRRRAPPQLSPQDARLEPHSYWRLDLTRHSAIRMGEVPGLSDFSLCPSPDYHYAYTRRLERPLLRVHLYLFDLKRATLRKLQPSFGFPIGWWDKTRILVGTTNHNYFLYDVATGGITPFIRAEQIAAFLTTNGITEEPSKARTFSMWDGQANQFYLRDWQQDSLDASSYLIRIERPDGRLSLVWSHFRAGHFGAVDRTGRYYLFADKRLGLGSDGVFVRDLRTGNEQTLVPPNGGRYYSVPRFYGDTVIYVRSNALWQIGLNGSNNVRLFPPPEMRLAEQGR